nr:aminoglycoside phosphotransferase family protein [Spelaeicoccus albus]
MIDRFLGAWGLVPDPAFPQPWHGYQSIVIPVAGRAGVPLALRIAAPCPEPIRAHPLERAALNAWRGRGSVRLLADDEAGRASLLERLDATRNLGTVPIADAIPVWGALVRTLSIVPPAGLPTVADSARGWLADFPRKAAALLPAFAEWRAADHSILRTALETADMLTGCRTALLVHGDLHYYNVLSELNGAGWRAIDPKPIVGPPEYAVAPMLWNRLYELPGHTPAEQSDALRARSAALAVSAGLDVELTRRLSIARELENMFWALADNAQADAARSLWVCRALAGADVGRTDARSLARLV